MHEAYPKSETQPSAQEVFQAAAEFINHFGIEVDPIENPDEFIEALTEIDPRYKGGAKLVRYQLEEDQSKWSEVEIEIIMKTAESLRMLEQETLLAGPLDAVIALGGARQSNLDRTLYAAEAVRKGHADFENLVVAGSNRLLKQDEQEATANYASGAKTEFDLCVAAAHIARQNYPELEVEYFLSKSDKAGTPEVLRDTLNYLRSKGVIHEGSSIATVTTQIYQAATSLDSARIGAEFGVETVAAGNPSDPKIVEARKPATYLSEVFRTLRAATLSAQAEKSIKP